MLITSESSLRRLSVVLDVLRLANEKALIPDSLDAAIAKSTNTHADLVQDVFYHYFEDWCPEDAEIITSSSKGMRHLVFPDTLVRIHFTSDRAFNVSVNRTAQTEEWNVTEEAVQAALDGIPNPGSKHKLVYQLDQITSEIERVAVGYYVWGKPVLIRELDIAQLGQSPTILPLQPLSERQPLTLKPQEIQKTMRGFQDGATG